MTEKEFVEKYINLMKQKENVELLLKDCNKKIAQLVVEIKEYTNQNEIDRTAVYKGIGGIAVEPDKLRTNVTDDNMPKFMEFLESIGRMDIVKSKPSIQWQNQDTLIRELIEKGKEVPEYVTQWYQPNLRIIKPKKKE